MLVEWLDPRTNVLVEWPDPRSNMLAEWLDPSSNGLVERLDPSSNVLVEWQDSSSNVLVEWPQTLGKSESSAVNWGIKGLQTWGQYVLLCRNNKEHTTFIIHNF